MFDIRSLINKLNEADVPSLTSKPEYKSVLDPSRYSADQARNMGLIGNKEWAARKEKEQALEPVSPEAFMIGGPVRGAGSGISSIFKGIASAEKAAAAAGAKSAGKAATRIEPSIPGVTPRITIKPGETPAQAIQRAQRELEPPPQVFRTHPERIKGELSRMRTDKKPADQLPKKDSGDGSNTAKLISPLGLQGGDSKGPADVSVPDASGSAGGGGIAPSHPVINAPSVELVSPEQLKQWATGSERPADISIAPAKPASAPAIQKEPETPAPAAVAAPVPAPAPAAPPARPTPTPSANVTPIPSTKPITTGPGTSEKEGPGTTAEKPGTGLGVGQGPGLAPGTGAGTTGAQSGEAGDTGGYGRRRKPGSGVDWPYVDTRTKANENIIKEFEYFLECNSKINFKR